MRRWMISLGCVLIALCSLQLSLLSAQEGDFQTGIHYDWWDNNNNEQGRQWYVPLETWARYRDFSLRFVGGYAHTAFDPAAASDISMSGFLDSKLNFSYELVEKAPVDILFGLDFNCPSGITNLSLKEQRLIMDPDLISITDFGEGFNVNPTVTFSKAWTQQWVTGIGLGYVWRGKYDYSKTVRDFSPGNVFTLVPEVRHFFSDQWSGRLFGNFTTFSTAEKQGKDYLKDGAFFMVGGGVTHTYSNWTTGLTLTGIIRAASDFYEGSRDAFIKYYVSQVNEFVADLAVAYALDEKTTLQGLLRYLWLGDNGADSASSFYYGGRNYGLIRVGAVRKFTPYLLAEFNVQGLTMSQGQNWYYPDGSQSYRGTGIDLRLTGMF
jgi:hypothetical protein